MDFLPLMELVPIFDVNARLERQRRQYSYHIIQNTRIDPLQYYSADDFRKRYRFTKDTFKYLCEEFEDDLGRQTNRHALSTAIQLAIALRFYATGSFLEVVGDSLMAVSKSTVSKVIHDVSLALSKKLDKFVSFPTDPNELRKISKGFYDIAKFPMVVGAIDGTHIRIQSPGGDQEPVYVNRKGYHSINVQGVCDHRGWLLNVVADWPGSVHDSTILKRSKTGIEFDNGERDGILLGDSGYACSTWILTPFLSPVGEAQIRYNNSHKKTRCVIERCFGTWKRRFHVLHSEIRMSPLRVCRIVGACAVLHNIAKFQHDDDDFDDGDYQSDDEDDDNGSNGNSGKTFRAQFAQRHFSRAL